MLDTMVSSVVSTKDFSIYHFATSDVVTKIQGYKAEFLLYTSISAYNIVLYILTETVFLT